MAGVRHTATKEGTDFVPRGWTTTPIPHTSPLYWGARAAIAKFPKLGGFNNRSLFHHSSGNLKAKFKLPAGLVPPEVSGLELYTATFSLSFTSSVTRPSSVCVFVS